MITNLRKGIAALSVFALGLMATPVNAASVSVFTDANSIPTWAGEAIEELMDQGVINGNDDGSFAPNRQLNRAEVSKIIVLATGVELDTAGGNSFGDVNAGDWYYDVVTTMYNYGWINGYPDGSFGPGNGINRAELAKMVVNAFELGVDTTGAPHFEDVTSGDWFYTYVETAYNNGLMRGYADGTFGPNNSVTRAETAKIVYDAQLVVAEPTGPAEGTLELSLSGDTPRGTNIPFNATSVPYTTLELTSSDDSDVEVSALTVTRLGLGDNDDFDNVWLEIDGFKVGNDKSINNDDVVELRFNPPIVVPAGQTLVADVVASMDSVEAGNSIGSQNRLVVVSADDLASTAANVVGDFPLEGEEMEIANYEVTQIGFSTLGSDTTVDVGDNFIEIGKFRLQNKSNLNKDAECRAITFKNDGQAQLAEVGENYGLYVSGEQVSAESIIDGDYVTFRLDNGVTGGYVIEDGDSRVFSVRADIVSAEDGDTVNFKVDNFEDVVCVEIGTSFGAKAVSDDSAATTFANGSTTDAGTDCANDADAEDNCARLRAYAIDSGDLNISRDPSSLGNQQYAPGSNDVVLLTARIIVDQPLIVDGVTLEVASGTTVSDGADPDNGADTIGELNAQFDNFRLFLNDKLVDSENNFDGTAGNAATTGTLDFNTTFEIAGTSILKLVANIENAAVAGTQLKLRVDAADFASPEYISTGDQVASTELLGSAEGSFVEVEESLLDITRTDGLSDGETLVAGVNDVTFLKFVLDNNDSGDVDVTSVSIAADEEASLSGNTRTFQNFTMAIFVDGLQQGSSKNPTSAGVATFNDLNVIIPSAGQKEFTLVANTIESSASVESITINGAYTTNDSGSATNTAVINIDGVTGDFAVGDIVTLTDAAGNTEEAIITTTALTTASTTIAIGGLTYVDGAGGDYATNNLLDNSVHNMKHTIQFDVTAVDADNVENGATATVNEGGAALDNTNRLVGAEFEMVQSGTLTASNRQISAFDKIIVANSAEVEVMQINFNASDDAIEVKDIYLVNDTDDDITVAPTVAEQNIDDRVDFKLYNEAGQLVQVKQMTAGLLHFELANQDRIVVPKDGRTYVTVKVDARNLTNASETGHRLRLGLDTDPLNNAFEGLEAVTAATGDDITLPASGWGETAAAGNESDVQADSDFIVTRTKLSIAHSAANDNLTLSAGTGLQGIYRFQVTTDSAYDATLERLTFDIATSGITYDTSLLATELTLVEYGNSGFTGTPVDQGGTFAIVTADSVYAYDFPATEEVNAGETKYYELRIQDGGAGLVLSTGDNDAFNVKTLGSDDTTIGVVDADRTTALGNAATATDFRLIWSDRSNDGNPGSYLSGYGIVMPSDTDGSSE